MEKHEIINLSNYITNGESFEILTCVDGEGFIESNGVITKVSEADSVFIPAALGKYAVGGNCAFLRSYVPDINKDFVQPLRMAGYNDDEINDVILR